MLVAALLLRRQFETGRDQRMFMQSTFARKKLVFADKSVTITACFAE
jgi:hypothetical protein